jgi:hypothetical protein
MAARKEKPIFKRLIAQQTTEHPRGSEDDYFDLLQRTMAVSPWIEYRGGNCPNISDQDIATASEFARELIQAKNFQEFAQIETAFIRRLLSRTDVAQETETTAASVKTTFLVADGATHATLLSTRPWQ